MKLLDPAGWSFCALLAGSVTQSTVLPFSCCHHSLCCLGHFSPGPGQGEEFGPTDSPLSSLHLLPGGLSRRPRPGLKVQLLSPSCVSICDCPSLPARFGIDLSPCFPSLLLSSPPRSRCLLLAYNQHAMVRCLCPFITALSTPRHDYVFTCISALIRLRKCLTWVF